ncbi:predicted protein [Botrytis cinerea T4]|uniref:Uncharacterized protein n=1 Tax=Botryotinia fuckeliana (strain T4) TaxID=999810 RepID=G2YZ91_BOTF4|nr:predicted protein [Botrytis cinerea T4]
MHLEYDENATLHEGIVPLLWKMAPNVVHLVVETPVFRSVFDQYNLNAWL